MTRILVIDDSQMMRLFLQRCLEREGFEVEGWMPLSALEVAERITAFAPDLILTDFQMPGCNGASVARKALEANPRIPVLVLTALRDQGMESRLINLRVQKILTKPIDAGTLVQAVRDALASAGSQD